MTWYSVICRLHINLETSLTVDSIAEMWHWKDFHVLNVLPIIWFELKSVSMFTCQALIFICINSVITTLEANTSPFYRWRNRGSQRLWHMSQSFAGSKRFQGLALRALLLYMSHLKSAPGDSNPGTDSDDVSGCSQILQCLGCPLGPYMNQKLSVKMISIKLEKTRREKACRWWK